MSKSPEADPEEGEIIDDDFEEISDNSIILNETGKSLSPKEHLPVISLSSVSEEDGQDRTLNMKIKRFRKFHGHHHHHHGHHGHHHHYKAKRKINEKYFDKYHKKKKWKRLKNSSYSSSSGSDSESSFDLELDRKLQNQLKAAIRVQTHEDPQKNSLKSRLKAMTNTDELFETKCDVPKSNNDKVQETLSEEIDNELIQLRLEALKTAVLNKYEHRKKRKVKEMEENEVIKSDNLETNKENTANGNMLQTKRTCVDRPDINSTPPDEDEDVLRALLLASMSKKITKDVVIQKVELPPKNDPKPNQTIIKPNIFIKKVGGVPLRQHVPPKIKPIIININADDSESDDDKNKTVTVTNTNINTVTDAILPINKINSEIESTVERFLKEQRAKVEAQLEIKKPITPKTKPQTPNESVILEKSAVKLLPKVKQIEYHKLLQRLKNAQKKPRVRRVSFKGCEEGNSIRKIIRNKVHIPGKCGGVDKMVDKVPDIKQDARILHSALKQMQKQKNGRLQIEEKYVVLTPIIRKINEATTERKKYDQKVKKLLEELAEAKAKLHETHLNFSMCVKDLLTKKEEIDKSSPQPALKKNGISKISLTSTPKNNKPPVDSFETSTAPNTPNSTISTNTPKLSSPAFNLLKSPTNSTFDGSLKFLEQYLVNVDEEIPEKEEVVLRLSEMEIVGSSDLDEINPGDPNDIHRIYEKQQPIPKYVSPLDSVKREVGYDPFVIMCPYDIDGNCRDPECTYKHYSR